MAATSSPLSGQPRLWVQDWRNKVGGMALQRGAKRVRGSRKTEWEGEGVESGEKAVGDKNSRIAGGARDKGDGAEEQ